MVRVQVKLFAILREQAGVAATEVELRAPATVADAREALAAKFPAVRDTLARSASAVNRTYAAPTTPLSNGDELALIPPVSGG